MAGVRPNGELVRGLREQRGWSQEALAQRAVVDVQTLRRIERGGPVRRASLLKVAAALELTIGELLAAEPPAQSREDAATRRLRAATAAHCGGANLATGIASGRVLPLREFAVARTLALCAARPQEAARSLLRSSRGDAVGRWLVIGEAGAGKTTFLQQLGLELAGADEALPLVVRLGALAQEPVDAQAPEALLRLLSERDREVAAAQAARGRVALLLDGLDEVLPARREQVRGLLAVAAASWPCPIVVTSRPHGVRCPGGFELAALNPLDDAQVGQLLSRWREAGGERPAAPPSWGATLGELRRNPLLLTFAALLLERGAAVRGGWPTTRHALFEQTLSLLLEALHRPETSPRMTDLAAATEALEHLAYRWTEEGVLAESKSRLAARLREDAPLWARIARVPRWAGGPEALLDELADRSGVLGQHDGVGTPWRFWHRSLQELLAARHLARRAAQGEPALAEVLEAARAVRRGGERAHWVEPFAFLCGELARPDAALLALAEADPEIAVRGLEAARRVEPATLRELAARTVQREDARPRARMLTEGMRHWWGTVGDSARSGLVKAIEYQVGGWIGEDAAAQGHLRALAAALARPHADAMEVDGALDALARALPCFGAPLRGTVYLQLPRLLRREQAVALALELWGVALERGVDMAEELFFLAEVLAQLGADAAALYERLGAPPADLIEWCRVPAGEHLIGGRAEEGFPWERPAHRVTFRRGWLAGATPVTNAQFAVFDATHAPPPHARDDWGRAPVVDVSWYGAVAFTRWLAWHGAIGARLPTEAEWEYMARAGTSTAYWSGDAEQDLAAVGWYRENSEGRLRAVGGKPPNAWGLHDVHGNVWEWVHDWYGPYEPAPAVEPRGPSYGACRVLRGGSFAWDPAWARSAHRAWLPPDARSDDSGFRVVRVPDGP